MIPLNELKIGDFVYTPNPGLRCAFDTIQVLRCKIIEMPKSIQHGECCTLEPVNKNFKNIRSTGRSLFRTAQECKNFYKNHYIIRDIVVET
jgi:hypothetical protein